MSQDPYLESIKETFSNLDIGQFTVHYAEQIIFICGGIYEHRHAYPQSLRERILLHLDATHEDLSRNRVLAEDFKDYFLHGRYDDLMQFEVDIANISSLIVICMESPGSLVEFGLFCGHVETAKKLLVFMPEEHYEDVDSFITLGPISDIKKDRLILYALILSLMRTNNIMSIFQVLLGILYPGSDHAIKKKNSTRIIRGI